MRNLFFVILLAACTYDHVDAQSFPETKKAPLGCLYGFVDTSGEWLIEPQYDDVRRFFDAAYKYYVEQDSSLNKIPLSQYRVVEKGGLKGLLNQELQTVLPLEFKTIAPKLYFDSMGLQYAPCDTLNLFGEFLLESPYHSAISHSYSFGIYYPALCSKTELYVQDTNNNWMVFNLKSKQLSPSFLQARWLDNQKVDDVQIFSAEDGVGIYRSETVIQLSKYNSLFPIFKNRLIAFQKDKLGLIDDMGNEVIACEYDSLVPTWFNGAIHFYKSGDLYVYNKDGNLLLKILDVKEVSRQLQTIKSIGDLFWFYSHSNEDFMQYGSMTIKNKKGKTWFINGSKEIVSFTHKDEIELASSSLRTKYYEVNGRDGKGVLAIISSSYQENKLIAQTLYQKIEVLESQNWFKLYTKDSVIIITDEGKHITTLARRSISSIYETWPGLSDLYTIQCKDGCRQFVSFNRLTYSNCGNELVLPANHISGGIVRLKRIDQRYLVLSSKGDTLTTKPIDTFFLKLKPGYWDKSEKYVDDIVLISGTELISLNKTLGYDHEKKEPIAKPYHAWTNDSLSFILDTNNKILKQFKGRASIHNRVYKRKKVFEVVYKMDTQFYVPVYKSNISKNDLDETSYSLLEKVGYYYKSNQELFANTFEYIRPVKGIGFVGADENYMLGLLDKNTNLLVKFKFYDDVIGLYGFNNKDSSFFLKHYAGMVAHKKGYKHNAYWKLYRLDKHGNLKELSHMRFDIPLPIENKSLFCDSDGDWGLMNANGYKTIINAHYNSANYQKGQAYFFLRLLQKSWNKQTNEPEFQRQYLVTDTNGLKLYEGFAESVSVFKEGKAIVIKEDSIKILTLAGKSYSIFDLNSDELKELVQIFLPTNPPMYFHQSWTEEQKKQYVDFFLRRYHEKYSYFSPSFGRPTLKAEERYGTIEYYNYSYLFKTIAERKSVQEIIPKPYEHYYQTVQSSGTFSLCCGNYVSGTYAIYDNRVSPIRADQLVDMSRSSNEYIQFNALIRSKLEQNDSISIDCSLTNDYLSMVGNNFVLSDENLTLYFYDNNSRKYFPVILSRDECDSYLLSQYR